MLGSWLILRWALKQMDPNRSAKHMAKERRKELARRLGRDIKLDGAYEDVRGPACQGRGGTSPRGWWNAVAGDALKGWPSRRRTFAPAPLRAGSTPCTPAGTIGTLLRAPWCCASRALLRSTVTSVRVLVLLPCRWWRKRCATPKRSTSS